MRTWLLITLAAVAGCKHDDAKPAETTGSGSAKVTVADAGAPKVVAAAPDAAEAAPTTEDEATPSEKALKQALAGTPLTDGAAISADGTKAALCTAGDNGQADQIEVVCHVATVGKGKAQQVPVLAFADSQTLDQDGDSDKPDPAKTKPIVDKLAAAVATVKKGLGDQPRAVAAACELWSASRTSPDDPPCTVGGVTVALGDDGKVTAGSLKDTFTIPAGQKKCSYDATGADVYYDDQTRTAIVSVAYTNPSDDCDLITQYEVHAIKLPAK